MLTKISLTFLLVTSLRPTVKCALEAYPPPTPCPAAFTYSRSSTGRWYGVINIRARGYFTEVNIRVRMRVAYYRPEAGLGAIEVEGGNSEIQDISRRAAMGKAQWLPFRVRFPPIDEVPSFVGLTINDREFCPTQPAPLILPAGAIELTFNLTTGLTMGRQDSDVFDVLPVPYPGCTPATSLQNVDNVQNVQYEERTTIRSFRPYQDGHQYQHDKQQWIHFSTDTVEDRVEDKKKSQRLPFPYPYPPPPYPASPPIETAATSRADYFSLIGNKPVRGISSTSNVMRRPVLPPRSTSATPYVREEEEQEQEEQEQEEEEEEEEEEEINQDGDIASEYSANMYDCGTPSTRSQVNSRIVNGQDTVTGQWPWHVAIFRIADNGDLVYQCGGSLISKRHVITAAQCVSKKSRTMPRESDTITLYLGRYNLRKFTEKGQQPRDVDHIIMHPKYSTSTFFFNVAIIVLTKPAVYSNHVTPICLWDRSPDLQPVLDQPGTVLGWGRDEQGRIGNELKMAKMPIVSQVACLRSGVFYTIFTSNSTFCAGYKNGTSVCVGDSGGGMHILLDNPQQRAKTWYLRGLVSLSKIESSEEGTCGENDYVVFTDLAKLLPWIREQLVPPAS